MDGLPSLRVEPLPLAAEHGVEKVPIGSGAPIPTVVNNVGRGLAFHDAPVDLQDAGLECVGAQSLGHGQIQN